MSEIKTIDIKENNILKLDKQLLSILLKDMTTKKNILWATDNYAKYGYSFTSQITEASITGQNGNVIKPRTEKSKKEQLIRVKEKAEVFTPSWICNAQNNLVDTEWFKQKNVFNFEQEKSWRATTNKIIFPEEKNKTWQDYVRLKRLEITCGEAPYLVSRYDAVTGEYIPVNQRIGMLDRKLRIINENTTTTEQWLQEALIGVKNIYGFDWQGDNILIARENLLYTIVEHFEDKFEQKLDPQNMLAFAKVIAWNIWQMDGLKFVIPRSCTAKTQKEKTLFGIETISTECEGCKKNDNLNHNGVYCMVLD
ncbi:MAG: restriction endonuclease subunit M [Treponemataceae bacterium]